MVARQFIAWDVFKNGPRPVRDGMIPLVGLASFDQWERD